MSILSMVALALRSSLSNLIGYTTTFEPVARRMDRGCTYNKEPKPLNILSMKDVARGTASSFTAARVVLGMGACRRGVWRRDMVEH